MAPIYRILALPLGELSPTKSVTERASTGLQFFSDCRGRAGTPSPSRLRRATSPGGRGTDSEDRNSEAWRSLSFCST